MLTLFSISWYPVATVPALVRAVVAAEGVAAEAEAEVAGAAQAAAADCTGAAARAASVARELAVQELVLAAAAQNGSHPTHMACCPSFSLQAADLLFLRCGYLLRRYALPSWGYLP